MAFEKFEVRYPTHQNAIDLFAGKWASDLAKVCGVTESGTADLFAGDPRPAMAAAALGNGTGRLDGMRVLELGPLEAGHSYQLEKLGAEHVLGIEANAEAYLKCLVVKEMLDLRRCRFLLGDVEKFLKKADETFDIVFCSGILYHMHNPLSIIQEICRITDRCFVWTHYYTAEAGDKEGKRTRRPVEHEGFAADYYELEYKDRQDGTFWGGNTDRRAWMTQDSILGGFKYFGLTHVEVLQDTPSYQSGAAMSFAASRKVRGRRSNGVKTYDSGLHAMFGQDPGN